jgi:hypothetical protein
MFKKLLFLSISIALAILAVIFQRLSSPDKPRIENLIINGITYSFELPTVHEDDEEFLVEVHIPDSMISGNVYYRQFKVNENWKAVKMIRMNDNLVSVLPTQKPIIKLAYYLELQYNNKKFTVAKDNPAKVRFQKKEPKILRYPYELLMFVSLIFTVFSAFLSIYFFNSFKKYFNFAFYTFLGGTILGLIIYLFTMRHVIIQFAPYNDVTFYKILIAFAIYSFVFYKNKKQPSKWYAIIASIGLIFYYFIPQSLFFVWL